jgi:hypothetical protein
MLQPQMSSIKATHNWQQEVVVEMVVMMSSIMVAIHTKRRKWIDLTRCLESKSSRLHVDIFRFCFHSFELYAIDSSILIGNSPEISNFNRLFLKLNRYICS